MKDIGGRRTFAEKLEQTEQEVGGGQGERGQVLPGLFFFRFRGEKRRGSLDFVEKKLGGAKEQGGERRSRRRSKAGEEKMMRCC